MGTVITQLLGGLGNQMFQYAVGRRLALEKKRRLLVDTSILEDHSPGRHEVNRAYGLGAFKVQIRRASVLERWLFNAHGLPFFVRAFKRMLEPITSRWIYREKSFSYQEELFSTPSSPRYIQGLWQSYKYLEPISEALKKDFEIREPLVEKNKTIVDQMKRAKATCLHVRRGDYVSGQASKIMGFVGENFYQAADQILKKQLGKKPSYYVFSDDIDWCREQLGWLGADAVFSSHAKQNGNEAQDLYLMSQATNFIIPNSTYAWWAAWLSANPDKKVIAPAQWFVSPNIDTKDLCPPSWQRI